MASDKVIMDSFVEKMNKQNAVFSKSDVAVYLLLYRYFEKNSLFNSSKNMNYICASYRELADTFDCSVNYLLSHMQKLARHGLIVRERNEGTEPYFTFLSLDV